MIMCKAHGDTGGLCACDKTDTKPIDTTKQKQKQTTPKSPCQHSHPPTVGPAPPHPNPCPPGKEFGPMPGRRRVWQGKRCPVADRGHPPQRQTQGRYYLGEGRAAPGAGGGEAASSCQLSSPLFLLWAESYSELTETLSSSIWKDKTGS